MSIAASILSGMLFVSALVLFLRGAWKGGLKAELNCILRDDFQTREYIAVLLLCLGSLVLHAAVASGIRLISGRNDRLIDAFRLYSGLDSKHYFDIARSGYSVTNEAGEILDLVFFPGYPLLTGMLMMVFDEMLSGYLAAWIPFLIAGAVLYRLFRLDYDRRKSLRILLWLCLMPGAVFYSYPMSESLFLAAVAGAVYMARTRRWFAAGVCGFLAAFTRSVGILLLLPLGVELLEQYTGRFREERKGLIRDAVCLLLIPLALGIYLYINFVAEGDPLKFLQYQKSNWHQEASWFFRTAGTQTDYAVRTWTENPIKFWGLWMPNLAVGFGSLLLMLFAGRKLRLSDGVWFFAYFAVCYGTSWLLSGPRYMAVFYPAAILAEELRIPKTVKIIVFAVAAVFYAICFGMRWSVW